MMLNEWGTLIRLEWRWKSNKFSIVVALRHSLSSPLHPCHEPEHFLDNWSWLHAQLELFLNSLLCVFLFASHIHISRALNGINVFNEEWQRVLVGVMKNSALFLAVMCFFSYMFTHFDLRLAICRAVCVLKSSSGLSCISFTFTMLCFKTSLKRARVHLTISHRINLRCWIKHEPNLNIFCF